MVKSYRSGARILWYVAFAYQHLDAQTLKFDFEKINKDLKRILTLCPDAYIALNFRFSSMPSTWLNAHPDDIVQYASGKKPSDTVDQLANYLTVSSASETFRKFFADSMGEFARFAQAQDWGKRVVAMRSSFGVYSEWHYNGMQEDMPDTSPAMTRYFRNFLKDKYQTDAALAAAWHMPGVTLATAQVPGAAERQGDGLYLRDPATAEKQVMDYYECHQHANATMLLNAAREIKKVAPNWLVGAYYGYVFNMSYPSEGQTLMLDKVYYHLPGGLHSTRS